MPPVKKPSSCHPSFLQFVICIIVYFKCTVNTQSKLFFV
nr:MAG TPA: hypothetical protein [Caudoviricetes sp.]